MINDFGLFSWDPIRYGQFLIVHWKEDLPPLLIVGFWFCILAAYLYYKDKKQRRSLNPQSPGTTNLPATSRWRNQ